MEYGPRRELTAWSRVPLSPDSSMTIRPTFDDNGRWTTWSDYGDVWYPTVVAADWGRIRGQVGLDSGQLCLDRLRSWGWAPCHYGRWVFVHPRGWCWVPAGRRRRSTGVRGMSAGP